MTTTLRSTWALCVTLGLGGLGCSDDPKCDKTDPSSSCADDTAKDDAGADDGDDGDDNDDGDDAMDAGRSGGKDAGRDAKASTPTVGRDSGKEDVSASKGDGSTPPTSTPDGSSSPPVQTACDPAKAPEVGKLALESVVTGLEGLTFAAQPPGSSDWYLLQQGGQVRVFSNGALKPGAFLDVGSEVALTSNPIADDERGLLGIAFPDDYESSGLFYIMLTPTTGAGANRDTVREYKRSADPYVADPMPTKTVVQLPSSAVNHNGGHIVFGPDKMLYVGTGDGGARCGTNQRGAPQDPKSLFGKILRLDPKAPAPHGAAGNPFPDSPLVWHYGLRNPYRFGFDKDTGDLFIGDVGQDGYEEVDYAPKGEKGLNFGWPTFEGKAMSSGGMGTCPASPLHAGSTATAPIIDMDRRAGATGPFANYNSVIGGYVYRGEALPMMRGVYVFGDYEGTRMGMLRQCGDKTSPVLAIPKRPDPNLPTSFTPKGGAPALGKLTAIVQDNQGELYFVSDFSTLLKVVPAS